MRAALKALRKAGAARLVLAVPLAPGDVLDTMRVEADAVVCLKSPTPFQAVGLHYQRFDQTLDDEVIRLLAQARERPGLRTGSVSSAWLKSRLMAGLRNRP